MYAKEVKKQPRTKNFNLTVYNEIKKGNSPIDICFKYSISQQALSYYLRRLKEQNLIKKIGYGTWQILNNFEKKEVKKQPKILTHNPKNIRGHGFMFKLKIPKIFRWNQREKYFIKKGIKYKNIHSNGHSLEILGKKVHLFNNSIIIYDKYSYIAELAQDSKSLAIYEFKKIIKRLETMLQISLRLNKQYKFKVLKEHYALIKNCMARQYNNEGKKLNVYNSDGLWLIIDNSFNLHELEVQKNRAKNDSQCVIDTEGVKEYFNSHQRTGFKITPEFMMEAIYKITKNQEIFDANMQSHLQVLKDLGNAVNELRREIKNDYNRSNLHRNK